MRWMTAGLCALSLAGALGCPHSFGRGGTVDRAVHKDAQESLEEVGCSEEERIRLCGKDKKDSEECFQLCD